MGFFSRAKQVKDNLDAECQMISNAIMYCYEELKLKNIELEIALYSGKKFKKSTTWLKEALSLVSDLRPFVDDYKNNYQTQKRFRFWINSVEYARSQTSSIVLQIEKEIEKTQRIHYIMINPGEISGKKAPAKKKAPSKRKSPTKKNSSPKSARSRTRKYSQK